MFGMTSAPILLLSCRNLFLKGALEHTRAVLCHEVSRQNEYGAVKAAQISNESEEGVDLSLVSLLRVC